MLLQYLLYPTDHKPKPKFKLNPIKNKNVHTQTKLVERIKQNVYFQRDCTLNFMLISYERRIFKTPPFTLILIYVIMSYSLKISKN